MPAQPPAFRAAESDESAGGNRGIVRQGGASLAGVTKDRTTRRRFLRRLFAGGALLALGGAVAAVRTHGYAVPAERAARLVALAPWQLVVVEHAARRIAAPDDPRGVVTPDDVDVAGFVDGYVAGMPGPTRADFLRLLGYLEHLAPTALALGARFTRLAPNEQDRVLAALEASSQELLRAGFAGLKALVYMGYYRDPRTWNILGYDGPLVRRPPVGWSL
jgi:Gluconate 2-dehydrogenase subunit 3